MIYAPGCIYQSGYARRLKHLREGRENFGHYLAGLIEGDGSIIVPRTSRNEKGKLLFPQVKITFVDKDAPLAAKIKEVLGAGSLDYPKNTKYVDLRFQDVNSIRKIAVLRPLSVAIRAPLKNNPRAALSARSSEGGLDSFFFIYIFFY